MFKNKIEHWAKEKGYKHKYLAEKCGVSEQTFVRWIKNRTQPDLEKAFLLANLFKISLDQLGEFEEELKGEKNNDIQPKINSRRN